MDKLGLSEQVFTDSITEPEIEIASTKSKDDFYVHYYKDIIKHPNGQFRLSLRFGYNNSCVFSSSENLNYTVISIYFQKLSTLTIAKLRASTRTDIEL